MTIVQWAHQGGAKEAPANTLEAMAKALRQGSEGVGLELDVHLAGDDQTLVVMHDASLDDTTNGFGRIRRHEFSGVIDRLDAAHWWTEDEGADHSPGAEHPLRGTGVRVPTLRDVLELRRRLGPDVPMTIEVKARRAARPTIRLLHEEDWGPGTVIVTSFRGGTVRRAKREHHRLGADRPIDFSPGLGYLVGIWVLTLFGLRPPYSRYPRLQIPTRKLLAFATPRLIEAAHRTPMIGDDGGPGRRLQVDVWTIDDADTMRALLALRVDGIMTDCPSVLRDVVGAPRRTRKQATRRPAKKAAPRRR